MGCLPIEDYGIIGDLHTAALVGKNGSIDWLCLPHFDSPSVFSGILDHDKGGRFQITVENVKAKATQYYLPETNVLVTRFLGVEGAAEVMDYMVIEDGARGEVHHELVRQVRGLRGRMRMRLECLPAFNHAREEHETSLNERGAVFHSSSFCLGLVSPVALEPCEGGVRAEFTVGEGETLKFVLGQLTENTVEQMEEFCGLASQEHLSHTVEYWRRWVAGCTYNGRWREAVHRSALVLKLLTFAPTGAIVAAPTSSLPEEIGGVGNWDYRFTWIRDASFTLYALLRIGFTEEAAHFMQWIEARCHELQPDNTLLPIYSIDGKPNLEEQILEQMEGYRGSRPVRIGNRAHTQVQLDIYGELMDAVYLFNKYGTPVSYDMWTQLTRLLEWVCRNWKLTDEGIWEVRGGPRHFVYSRMMCWVALDRGIRLAEKRSFPADTARWRAIRDEIYREIMSKGWNAERRSFTQSYGSDALDASALVMPLVFFLSPTDPRMISTLDAIMQSPSKGGLLSNSLVYRYNQRDTPDGIPGGEGAFSMCTFWLVEALTRAGKTDRARLDQARFLFEQMLGYANHLGLYSEEIGPTGEHLGNFPQAFTHIALISAAFNLDRTLGAGA
ncbi:MAG: glycoside hydrolase family 15 protein [SAR202 cluster bacterium]|nr:glycoside hydrolase family 15 protein [SAR202 cluster bacterium]